MPYATQADMVSHFGERELIDLTDRFDVPLGLINAAVLAKALTRADAEIDGYLGVRFSLPLSVVPALLLDLACDIAHYHLYTLEVPDLVSERYKAAIKTLQAIADGRVSLGLPAATPQGGGLVEMVSGPKLFSRGVR